MKDYEKVELFQEIERLKQALFEGKWLESYGRLAILEEMIGSELHRRVETSYRD